ncbi:uncharacterized protein LOC110695075 isoform X2 [Chenopodium quinoa]|uniref:uncharacterized protein LOC110695075 isoform X2 n=1 Tax=Chenopodium quinoa TaxID=63459 RepID=UPI000B77BDDB|nr:uncharacterized protein LOC110695075 isoform X2 [Chenopodium quinoa]
MQMQSLRLYRQTTNFLRHPSSSAMVAPSSFSLSSLYTSHSPPFLSSPHSNFNPNPKFHKPQNINISKSLNLLRTFKSSPIYSNSNRSQIETDEAPPPEPPLQQPDEGGGGENDLLSYPSKRSFGVATGEIFLGIASRLINFSGKIKNLGENTTVLMDEESKILREVSGEKSESGERIAKVIEDSLEPEVVWEQREKDVEEEKRRKLVTSPGFSFSAAGLLFPYHLGVAQFLIEKGYIQETTPLAGSSAGAIVCAVIASGSSMQDALQATKILAEDCRTNGTAFRLGAVLRDVLQKVLPEDAFTRCNGRVRVAITQIVWRPRGLLIDQFDSNEDLINALFTSSFIPGPATMFRNRLCIDGGLTLFMLGVLCSDGSCLCLPC